MKIGLVYDNSIDASTLSEWGKVAEKNGLNTIWLENVPGRDPYLNFALLAKDTRRIHMGPVAVSPYECHPIRMAMAVMTLNELSKGRAVIAVGAGGAIMADIGAKRTKPVATVRECIEIIKKASTGKEFHYSGNVFKVQSFKADWALKIGPSVYAASNGPKMLEMAGEIADGALMSDVPIKYVNTAVNRIKKGSTNAKRDFKQIRINNYFAWHVSENVEVAVKEARKYMVLRIMNIISKKDMAETIGLNEEEAELLRKNFFKLLKLMYQGKAPEGIPEETMEKLVEELTIAGNLDYTIEQLDKFKRAGLTEIALRVYGNPISSIKLLGEKVVPRF